MGTGSKHQFTLSVGIVDLTREEGGQLVRPAYRLIKEALSISGAEKRKSACNVNEKEVQNHTGLITNREMPTCTHISSWYGSFQDNPMFSDPQKVSTCVISFIRAK